MAPRRACWWLRCPNSARHSRSTQRTPGPTSPPSTNAAARALVRLEGDMTGASPDVMLLSLRAITYVCDSMPPWSNMASYRCSAPGSSQSSTSMLLNSACKYSRRYHGDNPPSACRQA